MELKNAVIVAYGRSAIAKAIKGSLRYTGCADYGSQVLKGILEKYPNFDPEWAEDLICGCAIPEAEQGLNLGRLIADSSGFPLPPQDRRSTVSAPRDCSQSPLRRMLSWQARPSASWPAVLRT